MVKPKIPFALHRGEAIRPGLLRILRAMGKRARDLGAQPERELEESIHDLRTLIKRLRAYLWFLRPVLGRSRYAKSNRALRAAAQSLSPARDEHAVVTALAQAAFVDSRAKKRLGGVLVPHKGAEGKPAPDQASTSLPLVKKSAEIVEKVVADTVAQTKRSRAEWPLPNEVLTKALRSSRKAQKRARHPDDAHLLHEWRKKTKRLFYLLQLTGRLPGAEAGFTVKRVDKLQELLGHHHDAVVAEIYLREHAGAIDPRELAEARHLLNESRKALFDEAQHCWQKMRRDF